MAVQFQDEGREAYRHGAWQDAYRLFSAADQAGPLDAEDLDRLGTAAYLTGKVETAGAAWARAHQAWCEQDATDQAIRCAFWLALTLLLRGEHARGGAWLARAGKLLPAAAADSPAAGYLAIPAGVQALGSDPRAAHRIFVRAGEIGDRTREPDLIALARLGCGQSLLDQGEVASGAAMLDDAMLTVTIDELSPVTVGLVYCAVIIACRRIFDLRRAQQWTAELSRWCEGQSGLVPYRGQCLVHRSEILQAQGDWAAASAEIEAACAVLADPPGDPARGMAAYQYGELLRLRGDFPAAEDAYRTAGACGHQLQPGLALLRLMQGRVDDAVAAVRPMLAEDQPTADRIRCLAASAEISLTAGDAAAARERVDQLRRLAGQYDSLYLRAVTERAEGRVLLAEGDPAQAASRLRSANLAWQELNAPYELALTGVLLGDACTRLGDHDTAALAWQAARETFDRLGAVPDLDRLAGRLGTDSAVLTDRECEIIRLVASGSTNRQIAAALVISEHTVRRHLQNIFGKLGLNSRAAATAYAYQHHLL